MSLYLKYRPRSFADVVGQEHVVTTLEHAVERDQLVHAYLFFGPRGTGKTSVARILAKILLIRGIGDETLQKQVIKSVDDGTLVDLIEIDGATNRKIDDVRDLKEKVQFSPSVASAKVYIIDEVHMMTREAFDALLKTLEEPPKHVYFILATTQLHKVPDTIQSRCQRFPFHPMGIEDIVRHLQNIADRERITVEREALRAIARHVNGGMRDAISLLDQLSSLDKVTEEDVRVRIGESAEEHVDRLWTLLDGGNGREALDLVSTIEEKGVSLEVFLRQMLHRARRELCERIAEEKETAGTLGRIDAIFRALRDLRVSPVPAVALEVAIVEMCGAGASPFAKATGDKGAGAGAGVRVGIGKKKAKREEAKEAKETPHQPFGGVYPERSRGAQGGAGQAKETREEVKEGRDATIMAKDVTREELEISWNAIVAAVPTASVRMSLKDASLEEVADGRVVLGFSSHFHRDKVQATAAQRELSNALREHFRQPVRVECVLRDGVPVPSAGLGAEAAPEEAGKGDREEVNVVAAVAEIFGK